MFRYHRIKAPGGSSNIKLHLLQVASSAGYLQCSKAPATVQDPSAIGHLRCSKAQAEVQDPSTIGYLQDSSKAPAEVQDPSTIGVNYQLDRQGISWQFL
jgi:hypothetical protein